MKKYYILLCVIFFISGFHSLNAQTINTVAGNGSFGYGGDDVAATATGIYWPWGVATDHAGNFYIADYDNQRIRMIDAAGIIHTIAGTGTGGFSGDGAAATLAMINKPVGIVTDDAGNIYFADQNNYRVRKIDTAGIITTVAGTDSSGYAGDGFAATAARITAGGVCIDKKGDIYFTSDNITYSGFTIRKVDTHGIITTVAGSNGISGFTGDHGPATAALLNDPNDVVVDPIGNLYILDKGNARIRKIDTFGVINTIVGNGSGGYGGDGGPATDAMISGYGGMAVNDIGEIFLGDYSNSCVRKIDRFGVINTIAGVPGVGGHTGDGGPAIDAELALPNKVALSDCGDIYVTDLSNMDARKITEPNRAPVFVHGHHVSLSVCESASLSIDSVLSAVDTDVSQTNDWATQRAAAHGSLTTAYSARTSGSAVTPAGLTYMPVPGYIGNDTFAVTVSDCKNAADTIMVSVTIVHCTTGFTALGTTSEKISVYPNPALAGRFILAFSSSETEDVHFTISNLLGEKVRDFSGPANTPADISLYVASGIYFVNATTAMGTWSKKIIVGGK